jgi:taurine--2-oxoglutarate transaminase
MDVETLITPERETVLHSWCVQADWDAPTVVGGQGAYLHLADGRQILDMSSLAECCNLGHQHPRLVEAIRENVERLCFVSSAWGAQSRAELAERLLERSGFAGGRVFFTLAGADANENAVKIARIAAGRPKGKVITRDRSYHGATHLAQALSGDSRTRDFTQPELLGIVHVPPPYAYRCPFGSTNDDDCGRRAADAVSNALDATGTVGAAAVLMEPNAGTNGIVAPDTYWPALRQHCTRRGVWLIADEVMSAFGRCGEWFAWQRHGGAGRPDMMTLAKGLTGAALPLGAVVISAEIAARIEHQMLYAGLTYCGHPLSCAAGVAAIAAYEEDDLIMRSKKMGARLLAELKQLQAKHPVIGDVRGGHGLFAVVELVNDRDSREPLAPWPQIVPALRALTDTALAEGVSFAVRGNLLLLAPPLVISEDALDGALAMLDRLLTRFFSDPPTESAP